MNADDRVLVGVINRRRDFDLLQAQLWYRIPIQSAPLCIDAEYIAFYLSRAFRTQNGTISFYARRTGFELLRRRDLLPAEVDHPHADGLYFKLQFRAIEHRWPPITNPSRRPISFIYTTGERFTVAATVADLYRRAEVTENA